MRILTNLVQAALVVVVVAAAAVVVVVVVAEAEEDHFPAHIYASTSIRRQAFVDNRNWDDNCTWHGPCRRVSNDRRDPVVISVRFYNSRRRQVVVCRNSSE
jgi:N-acyl-L-homoserine lactone synthetase